MNEWEIDPGTGGHLIQERGGKSIQWRRDSLSSERCWGNGPATRKRMDAEHQLTPCTKRDSEWVKDWNVSPVITKLLEENIGRTPFDINLSRIFFDLS